MFLNPLSGLFRALFSIALLVGAGFAIAEWYDRLPDIAPDDPATAAIESRPLTFAERLQNWNAGPESPTGPFVVGLTLLFLTLAGRLVSPRMWLRRETSRDRTFEVPHVHSVTTGHGYALHVEEYGEPGTPPLVLVHGAGSNLTQWKEAIADLADQFHVFAFDLLGHGQSAHDANAEHSILAAARDLNDVITLAGAQDLVLVGHSMGGMIAMTWCASHPERVSQLAGLVLVHTTPRNPFETMNPAGFHRAVQKWVHEPLFRLTLPLSGLVRAMHKLEYLNGTTHWTNHRQLFGGHETREQLDRASWIHARMDPGAVARFTLAMTRVDTRRHLPNIDVATLVVGAEKDGVTRPEAGRDIAHRIPGARSFELQHTRHMGYAEQRRQFMDAVVSFVEQPEVARRATSRRTPGRLRA